MHAKELRYGPLPPSAYSLQLVCVRILVMRVAKSLEDWKLILVGQCKQWVLACAAQEYPSCLSLLGDYALEKPWGPLNFKRKVTSQVLS